eukprot:CAMPEP_0194306092 /NCGR_PEP_ID=MMETSP0171-20130528/3359_1 /TAXON_ID=218684 /ORGANISM="Corethron pennatum, Strain L29A3" /LENGTH=228 /DNA_ID=CAMNT_0039057799 /DNA_START=217 /DNA_END=902 /DNA_ORIENTATION=-
MEHVLLSNDFILVDDRGRVEPSLTPAESAALCDRDFSVGGDGVLIALDPTPSSAMADVRMQRAGEVRQRHPLLRVVLKDRRGEKAAAGAHRAADEQQRDDMVNIKEAIPIWMWHVLDGAGTTENPGTFGAVSMGNPHCIVFVDDLEKDVDFHVDGPALEADATFPKKVNVEFVQVADDRHLLMKVWERGAGPTLACGTGACALAVAAMRAGKISRTKEGERVRVGLPG